MAEIASPEKANQTEDAGLPVRLRVPAKMPSVVAQHLAVQPNDDGVLLSFFEVIPPIMPLDANEEQLKQLRATGIIAECVSKVFIPGSRYQDFVSAMRSILPAESEQIEDNPEQDKQ